MTHGMADIEPGLRLHYVTEGDGPRTIVLLHGFPQTWWEWHRVIGGLVEAGFRVVAPDYRGAGNSWKPQSGYDKRTMARDIAKKPISTRPVITNSVTRICGVVIEMPRMRLKSVKPLLPPKPVSLRKNSSIAAKVIACVMIEK